MMASSTSSRFSEVPVVDVTASNIKELWPSLALALKSSTFVALDTELSGLGSRKLLGARSLPDRYKNICDVAKTRSVLSLGLSCFKLQSVGPSSANRDSSLPSATTDTHVQIRQWSFSVQTFNVTLLCSEDYMVEPGALKFLVEHGFDFNKQYTSGVSYCRGKEKTDDKKAKAQSGPTARQLFDILLWSKVPIVVHNGFVDLVFLYQNFYTELPSSLQVFLADLAEMFPQGILDTKYLVEFVDRLPATYLEYVFRKWQRKNALQASQERREVCLEFGRLPRNKDHVSYSQCALPATCVELDFIPNSAVLQDLVCLCYAGHGWCASGKQCKKSHAIDLILDLDGAKTAKSRKRRRRHREMQQQKAVEGDEHSLSASSDGSKRMCMDQETVKENRDSSEAHQEDGNGRTEDSFVTDSSGDMQRLADSAAEEEASGTNNVDYDAITDSYLKSSFQLEKGRSGGHKAGFDAFMTGFITACILSKHTSVAEVGERAVGACIKLQDLTGVEDLSNKIYTMGKDHPMIVGKSNFCNPSKNHRERIQLPRKA